MSLSNSTTSSSSSSSSSSFVAFGVVTIASVIVTAVTTHYITKRQEEKKYQRIQYEYYQRDLTLKKKTLQKRKEEGEKAPPPGIVLKDVTIDKVYLWQVEDLNRRFPGTKIENKMKFTERPSGADSTTTMRSPSLRTKMFGSSSSSSSTTKTEVSGGSSSTVRNTNYNKLITNHECILGSIIRKPNMATHSIAFVRAGPRKFLHFAPDTVNAAIVTCGGLCPGLNNVVREITRTLHLLYGIGGTVYGIQGGYKGFYDPNLPPLELTPTLVEDIHHNGGTVLGSSRGGFDLEKILMFIRQKKINQLYVIGGDGTHRGAFAIHEGCMEQGMDVSVAGIPKTIDNDVDYIDHSFGFSSAVEAAQLAIRTAKTEAVCNLPNGIGIVKLMGRSAGFIATHATMSATEVDLCLVPEVPIVLEGERGCLPHLRRRVKEQGYAVVVVAEGAGEEIMGTSQETDASGNKLLPKIGSFMKQQIENYFQRYDEVATVKYIDPSYMVRSVPANASDSLYCMQLAQNAVHGSMAGFTGFSVGLINNRMVFVPIPELVATSPRSMNPHGRTWERVLALTRQPNTVPELTEEEKNKQTVMVEPSLR